MDRALAPVKGSWRGIMKIRYGVLILVILLLASNPAQATKISKADLEATHILMGKIDRIESFFGVNERGDQIILSHVRVKALKWIKGDRSSSVEFIVEGGTVGDLSLRVSDIPEFENGQILRLLLKKENGELKYQDSEIQEPVRVKPARPAAGCCRTYASWQSHPASYLVNVRGADVDPLADIQAAAGAWNAVHNVLTYGGSSTKSAVGYDGDNVIFFNPVSSGGAIAVTYLWYTKRTGEMLEFDMYFFEDAWHFSSLRKGESCDQGFYYQ